MTISALTHPPVCIDGATLLGVAEAAELFGVTRGTVYSWLSVRKIMPTPVYLSGSPIWPLHVLEEWGVKTGRLYKLS